MPETATPFDPPATWPRPDAVGAAFGLSGESTEMVPVGRAWSNRVFRLRVGEDLFALKELRNPWRLPRWLEWLEESFRFEQVAISAGVRAPEPIPTPDGKVAAWVERQGEAGTVPVRMHRWAEGPPCSQGPVEVSVAEWAGETLALLHGLGVPPRDRSLFPSPTTSTAEEFSDLVAEAAKLGAPWSDDLARLGDPVARAADLARIGMARDGLEVMSHGDIDQKNLVAGPTGPVLCDWDVASPWVPTRELVSTAISLGRARDFAVARRVVAAYERATGTPVRLDGSDLAPSLMVGLDWLAFNVERSIGIRAGTPAERALSDELVPDLIVEYRQAVELADAIPDLLLL